MPQGALSDFSTIAEYKLKRRRLMEADVDNTNDGQANALLVEASSNATGYPTNHTLITAILDADYDATEVFRVSMQPRTDVLAGGFTVVGGATILSGGVQIEAGGLTVIGGGTILSGGLRVAVAGFTVTQGGSFINDDSVFYDNVEVERSATVFGSITASAGILTIRGIATSSTITASTSMVALGSITASAGTLTIRGIASSSTITASTSIVALGSITASAGTLTIRGIASSSSITASTSMVALGSTQRS